MTFKNTLPENTVTRAEGLAAFEELRNQAADVPEMSLEEINAEIAEVRKSRRR
ncbi:MAG: hypothetical protein ACI4YB_00290 [Oscillospiraceae bacterium]